MIPIIALLLIIGFLLAVYLLKKINFLEAVSFSLVFAGIAVPWVTINIALAAPTYVSRWLIVGVGIALLAILAWPAYKILRQNLGALRPTGRHWVVLAFSLPVILIGYFYYTDSELFLSIVSYLTRGEAKCFEMQTFKLFGPLNTNSGPEAVCEMFKIISTPGNAIFTANSMPVFGLAGFHVLYIYSLVLIYFFVFLFLHRWTGRYWLSIAVALFASANPYVLFSEVLDRNLFVYAMSAALFYVVFFFRDRWFVHGLLFGAVAGMGLRFLPLTFVVPILLLYFREKAFLSRTIRFLLLAGVIAAFNIPHLSHHGFHSLGETEPFWRMLITAFTGFERTPFMPFPNSIFYPLDLISFFGVVLCAVAAFGFYVMLRKDRRSALAMILMVVPIYLVLTSQSNWIEGDKARIFVEILFPVMIWIGIGLDSIFTKEYSIKKIAAVIALMIAFYIVPKGIERIDFPLDHDFYRNKPIYQTENDEYYRLLRTQTLNVGLFPNYGRLFLKINLAAKKRTENALKQRLFGQGALAKVSENSWVNRQVSVKTNAKTFLQTNDYVSIKIDFSKLASNFAGAAVRVDNKEKVFVNFEKEKDLLDIYYKQFKVPWQSEILPVTVFPDVDHIRATGEIYVDVNSFISFGKDEIGFVRINQINFFNQSARLQNAFSSGLTALPQTDDLSAITLRVPAGVKIILRNWIVNGANGTPHRLDCWAIDVSPQDEPEVSFYPWEPESYL